MAEKFQELDQRNQIVDQAEIEFQGVEDLGENLPEFEELAGIEAPPAINSQRRKEE